MDEIDRATHHTEHMLDAQLTQQVGRGQYQGESASECDECGHPIPLTRQRYLPGVRLCVPCQTVLERPRS